VASCHGGGIATEKNPNGLAATRCCSVRGDLHFHFPDINFWSLFSYEGSVGPDAANPEMPDLLISNMPY